MFILSVLMPLSMMSIGFSSWTITSVQNVNGSFTTETVLDKGTYITSCEVEYFEYMSTGFFTYPETETGNHTPQISDVGYITTTLTINLEKCRSVFTSGNDLQLEIELFNNKTVKDGKTTLSLFPYFKEAACDTLENNTKFEWSTEHVLTEFYFTPDTHAQTVTYAITFTIDATDQFEEVYPILQAMAENRISIIVQAAITEVTE